MAGTSRTCTARPFRTIAGNTGRIKIIEMMGTTTRLWSRMLNLPGSAPVTARIMFEHQLFVADMAITGGARKDLLQLVVTETHSRWSALGDKERKHNQESNYFQLAMPDKRTAVSRHRHQRCKKQQSRRFRYFFAATATVVSPPN